MHNKKLLSYIIIALSTISISACSSTKAIKGNDDNPVKYRVQSENIQQKSIAKLSDTWAKKGVENKPVVKLRPKTRIINRPNSSVQIKRKLPKARYASLDNKKNNISPIYNRPISNIRYATLSGDYSNNRATKKFINKMVSKHGFDRGYLNYLFSKTVATPFLKRMAYSDAFGRKKSKIKRKPRAGRWNRYRGNFLTERTISKGVEFWKKNRVALKKAEERYGVPQEYILGIIGVETRYGENVGKNRAIDALSAMGFNNPRRGKYFMNELESYLLMTRKERLDPFKPMASYAGALGICQFMPSNIKRYAVDHDRSGTVNLWTPADAIGSVANYFNKHGWRSGGTVAVKASSKNSKYRSLKTGFKSSHSLSRLKSKGVSAKYLGDISGKASLIKLSTYSGEELWLGGHNFYVITRYNHSSHYAMAVHQLAEEIKKRIGDRGAIRQAKGEILSNNLLVTLD